MAAFANEEPLPPSPKRTTADATTAFVKKLRRRSLSVNVLSSKSMPFSYPWWPSAIRRAATEDGRIVGGMPVRTNANDADSCAEKIADGSNRSKQIFILVEVVET
jgi:hypothetical protein